MALMDIPPVGASDAAVKRALALRRQSSRDRARLLLAEGVWAHEVLLEAGGRIESFFWCPEAACTAKATTLAERVVERADTACRISAKTLRRLTERDKPDGLVSVLELPTWTPDEVPLASDALVAVADGLETPGNVGTLIRTLDACGVDALVITNRRTRLTHPQIFRASHGMNLVVPQLEFAAVRDAVAWLARHGFTAYLAHPSGGQQYRRADYSGRTAIVFGSERFGVSPEWLDQGWRVLALPMLGRADSLNVAVSAAVLLYEARARKAGW